MVFLFDGRHSPFAQHIPGIQMSLACDGFEASSTPGGSLRNEVTERQIQLVNELPLHTGREARWVDVFKCSTPLGSGFSVPTPFRSQEIEPFHHGHPCIAGSVFKRIGHTPIP